MILIELEAGKPRTFHLEFHPYVTVVADLTPQQRSELALSINRLVSGVDVGLRANVDVDGIPQPLTGDLIAALGLNRDPIDNILQAADVPGAVVEGSAPPAAPLMHHTPTAADLADDAPLAAARADLEDARRRLNEVVAALEKARRPPPEVDTGPLDEATAVHQKARQKADRIRDALSEAGGKREPREVRLHRLRTVRNGIEARIVGARERLEAPTIDTAEVEAALQAMGSAGDREFELQMAAEADALATEWADVTAELDRLATSAGPPQWVLSQARSDLEDAEAQVRAMRIQLESGIDVRSHLARKEQHLVELREVWEELQHGNDAEKRALQARRSELHERAIALLGHDPGPDNVGPSLREQQRRLESALSPVETLIGALRRAGVAATAPEAEAVAIRWLRARSEIESRLAAEQQELAAASMDLLDVKAEIEALENAPDEPEKDPAVLFQELAVAEAEETRTGRRVEELRAVVDATSRPDLALLQSLDQEQREAAAAVDAATRKVDYFTNLLATQGEPAPPPALAGAREGDDVPAPWWEGRAPKGHDWRVAHLVDADVDLSYVTAEDLEFYLLSRAAGLRRLGRGESVPLVIDAAFDGLDFEVARRAFPVLTRIAPIVQIIYLASNNLAVGWAERQDEMVAAVVRIETR